MDEQQMIQLGTKILEAAQLGQAEAIEIRDKAAEVAQNPQSIDLVLKNADSGDEESTYIMAVLMAAQSAQMAKLGAKLNYIQRLRGECPDGYEMRLFKQGGRVCKKCMKKVSAHEEGGDMNYIDAFKCGQKMKRAKKACGGVKMNGCGGKLNKPRKMEGGTTEGGILANLLANLLANWHLLDGMYTVGIADLPIPQKESKWDKLVQSAIEMGENIPKVTRPIYRPGIDDAIPRPMPYIPGKNGGNVEYLKK